MEHDNDSFESLFSQSEEKTLRKLSPGEKIKATVVGIDKETVFLDVGTKSEGIVEASEFTDEHGELSISPGDQVEVYCLKSGPGGQIFTAKLGSGASSAHLEEAYHSSVPVEGFVKAEIKGGFEITLSGNARGFCPYSQMGLRRVENAAETYLETHMSFLITKFEAGGRNIVLSARLLQEEERRVKKEELQEVLEEGQTIEGSISAIRPFGLFVDIGGIDGLVPISEVGWSRVDNLEETYQIGQQVQAVIKGLDWENDRINLSIKETLEDPWDAAVKNLSEGKAYVGTIARLAQFGAFVTLAPGVDGLVHISKLGAGRRINHPKEVVEAGQNLEVVIETIDTASRRISLVPSDYVSVEDEEEKERREFQDYRASSRKDKRDAGVGSFGALLKAKLEEKK
ncbi:MAG: 30S ribosomal protein S1 [Desulfofustis sp.]|nr:30S ribosomal protein S1 [Desulfofustis sp.]NNK14235.1 30S ribosomal protein S1 [Desulfofustis sp.]NNK55733.1 30S ribosomal protein S1 [Desulfofustis sp.]RZW25046.1 MAG: 30S ribosomal protein S1 [Desulfobulbaceae bacterium]